tara:strand:- start:2519 stop:3547 length:1029 start_codon:yes stop_codon:yes gene_type:complete
MKILVTGNNGYIGTVLSEILIKNNFEVVGLDNNYYENCKLSAVTGVSKQIIKDIRDIEKKDLEGIDGIIHLAALSNDPLGSLIPQLTEEINFKATIKLANFAKFCKVKRFVFVSSQSMYGISKLNIELDEDKSEKNPVTEYANTKWRSEIELKKLNNDDFVVCCFRPSTVFGVSARLRCDIVFNYFVACAFTTGKIEILSDGTPWRPVVHIRDVCNALISGLKAPEEIVNGKSFNVGLMNGNYTVKQLAETASRAVKGSELVFLNKHTDPRTYKVSFAKIFNVLGEYYKPKWNLDNGAKELIEYFKKIKFNEKDFKSKKCIRLKQLTHLIDNKLVTKDLKWI